ncbi:MAG: hypothetical protein HON53_23830 [Planctomycetaceae bacterium]|nr:hypothetical protein [Planctomycetaceae bacterium]MBT6496637.1 hypothetical protein [Planctomycetaceae bacterium]
MNPGVSAALTASTAATAAAAEQQRLQQQEEEEMTSYSSQDLEDDWEFKILRSSYGAFGDSDQMAEILEEESQAGWVLVEKFDHQRIRLKRRAGEQRNDATIDFDPYRTTFDERMPASTKTVLFGLLFFFLILIAAGIGAAILKGL